MLYSVEHHHTITNFALTLGASAIRGNMSRNNVEHLLRSPTLLIISRGHAHCVQVAVVKVLPWLALICFGAGLRPHQWALVARDHPTGARPVAEFPGTLRRLG